MMGTAGREGRTAAQKWEYMIVTMPLSTVGTYGRGASVKANPELPAAGDQGWELVSAMRDEGDLHWPYFKRPRQ
jgi:hypothetical protein